MDTCRYRMLGPRPLSPVLLFGLVPVATWFVVRPLLDPAPPLPALYTSVGFSIFAFISTLYLVPALGPTFVKANLKGRDLLKTYQTPMSVPSSIPCASSLTLWQTRKPRPDMCSHLHSSIDALYPIRVFKRYHELCQ